MPGFLFLRYKFFVCNGQVPRRTDGISYLTSLKFMKFRSAFSRLRNYNTERVAAVTKILYLRKFVRDWEFLQIIV